VVTENQLCDLQSSGSMKRMLDVTDYELVWPPELFAAEARRVLARDQISTQAIDLLLREAFRDDSAADDAAAAVAKGTWSSSPVARSASEMLAELAERAHVIRTFSAPRPYWPQRLGRDIPGPYLDAAGIRRGFADLVADLERTGYLDQAFPRTCVDDQYPTEPDPAAELEKRLGIANLWPLAPDQWDDNTFYGLIEVYHDLVSRPRERNHHDYSMCGWHYSHFSTTAGREVYRWKANELLQAGGISYRLVDSGEDQGRLVAVFDDARTALLAETLDRPRPDTVARIRHAVALFRRRGATDEDKRSALITLAGILEERRRLIKTELVSADEGALFQIASKFAIRHQNSQQLSDYDPAFLDWVFWWYLATVELTNRIITRQESAIT
jgi:hypothetical protein